uniref:Uncharacterized protein n=1 Tax=Chromera velia CCMP2878 TaxID=1169474 RepID=A0A0G4HPV0_9ALVE|eukprot:Cvel_29959.t1-p1 / transcript=Cvel_29959.t1 / gene=Cvel_29959 / organism=Chromera_velia_CCMP2878 / gene_product=Ankyrin-3, putative / transcript_product=Ankyrin-3, putative / location=Cvel_scaffold4197:766-7421(-) / protein_length=540 / sequence_SO=supercontig / SO=protein_coding / is_pseudo=false
MREVQETGDNSSDLSSAAALSSLLTDLQSFSASLAGVTKSLQQKIDLLNRLHGDHLRDAKKGLKKENGAEYKEQKQTFDRLRDGDHGGISRLRTALSTFQKNAQVEMDKFVSRYYKMDLSPLLRRKVGNVIRSFQPVDASIFRDALRIFIEADRQGEEGETGRKDRGDDFRLLLYVGADVNAELAGEAPLMFASVAGHVESVRLLVENGADLETTGEDGSTSLVSAAFHNQWDVVLFLLEAGADVHAADVWGDTALYRALRKNRRDVAEKLVAAGAKPGIEDLCAACGKDDSEDRISLVRFVLSHGGSGLLNCHRLMDKKAPLSVAISVGNWPAARLLMAQGADVQATDAEGCTALHVLSRLGEASPVSSVVNFLTDLVGAGADVNARNHIGYTPLREATLTAKPKIVFSLKAESESGQNSVDVMRALVVKGAEVNAQTQRGDTALHLAAERGFVEAVEFLLESGADIRIENNDHETASFVAMERNQMRVLRVLVKKMTQVESEGGGLLQTATSPGEDASEELGWGLAAEEVPLGRDASL